MGSLEVPNLRDEDLPIHFRAADTAAVRDQRSFSRVVRWHYSLLVLAAISGAFTLRLPGQAADLAGVLGAVCFAGSLLLRLYMNHADLETLWLKARSIAESAKSASWSFAVGGDPFADSLSEQEARRRFIRVQEDEAEFVGTSFHDGGAGGDSEVISEAMATLRAAPFETRQQAYLRHRVLDQRNWYARKAQNHALWANRWFIAMLLAEAAGLTAGVLKAAGLLDIDLLGVFGALASAFGAWNLMRQHRRLAENYQQTAGRLTAVGAWIAEDVTTEEWPALVARAESLMSDEQTGWQAIRAVKPGPRSETAG